jgi:hypothetical protein
MSDALCFRVRLILGLFIAGLVLSGLTAFPLMRELNLLCDWFGIARDARYPFLAHGTDWLAFSHVVITVFCFGAWLDAARHEYRIRAAMIACVMVIPLALMLLADAKRPEREGVAAR